jgi:hypothetical protein
MDPNAEYHVYDYWNNKFLGTFDGTDTISQDLRADETRMLSVRKAQDRPMVVSTDRHILQGALDLSDETWDAESLTLSAVSKVVAGDPYKAYVKLPDDAALDVRAVSTAAGVDVNADLDPLSNLATVTLTSASNVDAAWSLAFTQAPAPEGDAPGGITVTATASPDDRTIALTWNAAADASAVVYRVYRSEDEDFTPDVSNLVATTQLTSWTDAVRPNVRYYYQVVPIDRWANVGNAAAANAEVVVYFPVTMLSTDSTTGGKWIGTYGQDGYRIAWGSSDVKESLPSYVSALTTTGSNYSAFGDDPSGYLENPNGDSSTDPGLLYGSNRVTYNITPNDTLDHVASVYVQDNNPVGPNSRTLGVWAEDDDGNRVSETEIMVDDFRSGKYVNFSFSGKVTIVVSLVSGANAVASGIFFNSTLAPDKTALRAAINAVNALGDVSDVFTADSAGALATALADAKGVLADEGAGRKAVGDAVAALADALAGLDADPDSVYALAAAEAAAKTAKELAEQQAEIELGKALDDADTQKQLELAAVETQKQVELAAAETQRLLDLAAAEAAKREALDQATRPTITNPVVRVKLAQSQLRLVQGKSQKVGAGVYFADGSSSYLGSATWKSSSPNVATVSSGGLVKAKKAGKAVITFTSKVRNAAGKQLSAKVTVTVVKSKPKAKLSKVTAKVPKILKRGTSVYITGKYVSGKAAGVKVSYCSVKPDVAVVASAGRVVGVSKGRDSIVVKAGKKTKRYTITVK